MSEPIRVLSGWLADPPPSALAFLLWLTGSNPLDAKRIAAWPHHFIFGFTVRADRNFFDIFGQPSGANHPHASLTSSTAEDFLHPPSLLGDLTRRSILRKLVASKYQ